MPGPRHIAGADRRSTTSRATRPENLQWTLRERPSQLQVGAARDLCHLEKGAAAGELGVRRVEEVLADGHDRQTAGDPPLRVHVGSRVGGDVELLERTNMKDRDVE